MGKNDLFLLTFRVTVFSNGLTLGELRPRQEAMDKGTLRPAWVGGLTFSGPQHNPERNLLHPETFILQGSHLGTQCTEERKGCSALTSAQCSSPFVFQINKKYYSLKYQHTGLGFLAAIASLPTP